MCWVHGFRTCTKKQQKKATKKKPKGANLYKNVQDLRVRGEFTSIK